MITISNWNNNFQEFFNHSFYDILKYDTPRISKTLVGAINITNPYIVWIINAAKNLKFTVVPVKITVGVYNVDISVEKLL